MPSFFLAFFFPSSSKPHPSQPNSIYFYICQTTHPPYPIKSIHTPFIRCFQLIEPLQISLVKFLSNKLFPWGSFVMRLTPFLLFRFCLHRIYAFLRGCRRTLFLIWLGLSVSGPRCLSRLQSFYPQKFFGGRELQLIRFD